MRRLIAADLRSIRNALRGGDGRKLLASTSLGWILMAIGGLAAAGKVLAAEPVVRAARERPESVIPALFDLTIVIALLFAAPFAVIEIGRILFRPGVTALVSASPLAASASVRHAGLRAFVVSLWIAVLSAGPAAATVVARTEAGIAALAAWLAAVALLLLPVVAAALLFAVATRALPVDSKLRLLLNIIGLVAGSVLALLFAAGLVSGEKEGRLLAERISAIAGASAAMRLPGRLLAAAGGVGEAGFRDLAAMLAVLGAPPFWIAAARIFPAARERFLFGGESGGGEGAGRRRSLRRWPRGIAGSVALRDLLATLRSRGSIGALGFMSVLAVIALKGGGYSEVRVPAGAVPRDFAVVIGLASLWQILTIALVSIQGIGFLADEAKAIDLLGAAPASRGRILAGKLPALLFPHLWMMAVLLAAAPLAIDADARAVGFASLVLLPISWIGVLGVLAFATLPAFNVTIGGDPGEQTGRTIAVAIGSSVPGGIGIWVMTRLNGEIWWRWGIAREPIDVRPLVVEWLGLLWAAAALLTLLVVPLAARNLARILGPRA